MTCRLYVDGVPVGQGNLRMMLTDALRKDGGKPDMLLENRMKPRRTAEEAAVTEER